MIPKEKKIKSKLEYRDDVKFTDTELKKLKLCQLAIDNLTGIKIPYDIIRNNINPFNKWLKTMNDTRTEIPKQPIIATTDPDLQPEESKRKLFEDNNPISTVARRVEGPIATMQKSDKTMNIKSKLQIWNDKIPEGNQIKVMTTTSKLDGSNESTISSIINRKGVVIFSDNVIDNEFKLFKERMYALGFIDVTR